LIAIATGIRIRKKIGNAKTNNIRSSNRLRPIVITEAGADVLSDMPREMRVVG
jgi:hypothetical protein